MSFTQSKIFLFVFLVQIIFGARNADPLNFFHDKVYIYKEKLIRDTLTTDVVDITTRPYLTGLSADTVLLTEYTLFNEEFSTLKGFQNFGFNHSKCETISLYAIESRRALVSLAAYVYNAKTPQITNIDPSIIYAIEGLPKESVEKTNPGAPQELREDTPRACDNNKSSYIDASIELNGVVDISCVSNTNKLPKDKDEPETPLPSLPTKCDDQSEIKKYLTNYKFGRISSIANEDLKKFIVRVGPILTRDKGIIYGWGEGDYGLVWYTVTISVVNEAFKYDQLFPTPFDVFEYGITGSFLFEGSFLPDPKYCDTITSETPKEDCECPAKGSDEYESDPRHEYKESICASGSVRTLFSFVAVFVIVPILSLFW
ncbi:MAG: hypothetical protein EZS28_033218 [Streblomastix strix]|uniref:Uncharacterized protein n=1 Tax=Streblomastix strix TaxID=222440 RepID=A0A5J4UKS4_9EUKA|nr:MAG: hypothetical protein EZS28_033218 [Streblomastix strix]